jgi:hypothetical protein
MNLKFYYKIIQNIKIVNSLERSLNTAKVQIMICSLVGYHATSTLELEVILSSKMLLPTYI